MKTIFTCIAIANIAIVSLGCAIGVLAGKEHAFHDNENAKIFVYSMRQIDGNNGVFTVKGKKLVWTKGTYEFIDIPDGLPSKIVSANDQGHVFALYDQVKAFINKYPQSKNLLNQHLLKLSEYRNNLQNNLVLINGVWMPQSEYASQNKEKNSGKKERKIENHTKLPKVKALPDDDSASITNDIEVGKQPYSDGFLSGLDEASVSGAKASVQMLKQAIPSLTVEDQKIAKDFIKAIRMIMVAQHNYNQFVQKEAQSVIDIATCERQRQNHMKPNKLTGSPNLSMARGAAQKAVNIKENIEQLRIKTLEEFTTALSNSDRIACDLYHKAPKDAKSLARAIQAVSSNGPDSCRFTSNFDVKQKIVDRDKKETAINKEREEEANEAAKKELYEMELASPNERLLYGINKNLPQWVKKAIEDGANVNGVEGDTIPILLATSLNRKKLNKEIIRLLVDNGAKLDVRSTNGNAPFYLVESQELKDYFISKGYRPNPTEIQARENNRFRSGSVIQVLEDGILLKVDTFGNFKIVFAKFIDQELFSDFIKNNKNALAEGDICHYYYSKSNPRTYTTVNNETNTISEDEIIIDTFCFQLNLFNNKGRIIQILPEGLLVVLQIYKPHVDSYLDVIVLVTNHPQHNIAKVGDRIHVKGKRMGVFSYVDVRQTSRTVPKIECN